MADTGTRVETLARDGSLLKVTGSAAYPVRYESDLDLDGGEYRLFTREIKLDANGNDTSEWKETYRDMLGREYKTVCASASGSPSSQTSFNNLGQAWKEVDPDGVFTLYAFSANSTCGTNVLRIRTLVYTNFNDSNTTLVTAAVLRTTDGLRTWTTHFGLLTKSQTVSAVNGARYVTNTAPDNSHVVSYFHYGRLQSVTRRDAGGVQLGPTSYTYDEHGRLRTSVDARNGTTTFVYDKMDRVISTIGPAPGVGQNPQTNTTSYDTMGRVWKPVYADNTIASVQCGSWALSRAKVSAITSSEWIRNSSSVIASGTLRHSA